MLRKILIMENFKNNLPSLILLLYLIIGSLILPDYGISMDEPIQRKHGIVSFDFINEKFNLFPTIPATYQETLSEYDHRDYGVVFQLFSYSAERLMNINDAHSVFLLRHVFTFILFWLSAVFFYKLAEIQFGKGIISISGLLFYILSPRIFTEAFYNPKDIILLAWVAIGMYTMVKFAEQKTIKYLLLHTLVCALAINARVVGIVLPFVTLLYSLLTLKDQKLNDLVRSTGIKLIVWSFLTLFFTCLMWPFLWENPVRNFLYSFNEMKLFRWNGQLLYWGNLVWASDLPWHYTFSQILVTTPLLYIILFIGGFTFTLIKIIRSNLKFNLDSGNRRSLMFLTMFLFPILSIIYFHSILYNNWRQMYFIYPAFILIALEGLNELYNHILQVIRIFWNRFLKIVLFSAVSISICFTIGFLIKMHPYQYIYFNQLAGKDPLRKFDGDYFGLSYKEALEYLLETYPDDTLKINVANSSGIINKMNFSDKDIARLEYVDEIKDADFYITTYYYPATTEEYHSYWNTEFPFNQELIFNKEFRASKIVGVYDLRKRSLE